MSHAKALVGSNSWHCVNRYIIPNLIAGIADINHFRPRRKTGRKFLNNLSDKFAVRARSKGNYCAFR